MLEQAGGVRGLVLSTVPVIVFVPVNSFYGLMPALWSAFGVALAMLVFSVIRRNKIQPALSGLFGVGICALIAYRTGDARGYFLYGIIVQAVYAVVFVLSIVARWPAVGAIWNLLKGNGTGWRQDQHCRRWYAVATWMWAILFALRFSLQYYLYLSEEVAWLGAARIATGWPLTLLAAAGTLYAVRQAHKYDPEVEQESDEEPIEVEKFSSEADR